MDRQYAADAIKTAWTYARYKNTYWAGVHIGIAFERVGLNTRAYKQAVYCSQHLERILQR